MYPEVPSLVNCSESRVGLSAFLNQRHPGNEALVGGRLHYWKQEDNKSCQIRRVRRMGYYGQKFATVASCRCATE
jgi:hypothetical protein